MDGSVKNWNVLKTEYTLRNKDYFWKKCIKQTSENTSLLVVKHLLGGSRNYIHC